VFGELKISSNREDSNLSFTGRDLLPGYSTLNVGGTYALNKNLSFLLRINNLFDKQYSMANGFSTPGFNMFASLSYAL
jgi:vitamin B12 transporter